MIPCFPVRQVGSLAKPPWQVKATLECVCRLLGVAPPRVPGRKRNGGHVDNYWAAATALMRTPRALAARLRAVGAATGADGGGVAVDGAVRAFVAGTPVAAVRSASTPGGALAAWVHAVVARVDRAAANAPARAALAEARGAFTRACADWVRLGGTANGRVFLLLLRSLPSPRPSPPP